MAGPSDGGGGEGKFERGAGKGLIAGLIHHEAHACELGRFI